MKISVFLNQSTLRITGSYSQCHAQQCVGKHRPSDSMMKDRECREKCGTTYGSARDVFGRFN